MSVLLLLFTYLRISQSAVCPGLFEGTPRNGSIVNIPSIEDYTAAVDTLNIKSVFQDIRDLLTDSQTCWPADSFPNEQGTNELNYGGLFIRLTWHCAGTFRSTDGKGGCAGGRQRFYPEASWDDNTNLDKARALLAPIKTKYGDALSWGDLMVFAGTASILHMGGPVTQVCAGRIDEPNGVNSYDLIDDSTCPSPGNCEEPLGQSTIGLIYVNPGGINGTSTPAESGPRIKDVFGRMNMNDEETVALIGGGHAFGKAHGACNAGPGESPEINPDDPWNGPCGEGAINTFTSGFEGQWTQFPFRWDNEFFTQLRDDEYVADQSPAGNRQWRNTRNGYLMLYTDIALRDDPIYKPIVDDYAANPDKLDRIFSEAWAKLVTDGDRWVNNDKTRNCMTAQELLASDYEQPSYVEPLLAASVIVLVVFIFICVARDCCDKSLKRGDGMQRLISSE